MRYFRHSVFSGCRFFIGFIGISMSLAHGMKAADQYSLQSLGPELMSAEGGEWANLNLEFVYMNGAFDLDDFTTWESGLTTMPGATGLFQNDAFSIPNVDYWNTAFAIESNAGPFAVGSSFVLWGYSSKAVDPDSEWILLTDPNWTVGSIDFSPNYLNFSANTSALLGGFDWNTNASSSIASTAAVPEPGTYAALLGGATLLIVGFRRFRYRRAA